MFSNIWFCVLLFIYVNCSLRICGANEPFLLQHTLWRKRMFLETELLSWTVVKYSAMVQLCF